MVDKIVFNTDVFSETLNEFVSNVGDVQYKATLETEYFLLENETDGIDFNIVLNKEQFTEPLEDYRLVSCPLYRDDLIKLRNQISAFLKS